MRESKKIDSAFGEDRRFRILLIVAAARGVESCTNGFDKVWLRDERIRLPGASNGILWRINVVIFSL